MTRGELRTLVLSWLDDANAGYFTPAQVNVFLNNAQRTVQKRLIKAGQNYYVKCVTTSLVVNQADYVLPLNFKKVHRLEIIISGSSPNENVCPLAPITINQQDYIANGAGTPSAYFIKKNRLVLRSVPDQTYSMRMLYSYEVADMELDADEPDCPPAYHELIALHAAEDGFLKDGRSSELLSKKLEQYKIELDQDAQERNQDVPRMVVQTNNDYDGGFFW